VRKTNGGAEGMDKLEIVAYVLLGTGLALLVFTFALAFNLFSTVARIFSSSDLLQALGEILGPATEAIVKFLYLAIMAWVGSIMTMRGIQLYRELKATSKPASQIKAEDKKKTGKK
jgi:hypothetical protein